MQALVTIDGTQWTVGMPPEQVRTLQRELVLPSLEKLNQWQQEGKVHGGILPAERAGAFVIEGDSIEEIESLLVSLPYWGLVKMEVRALVPVSNAINRFREGVVG